jgi:hypothetical protein
MWLERRALGDDMRWDAAFRRAAEQPIHAQTAIMSEPDETKVSAPKIRLFGRGVAVPRSRALRVALGVGLVLAGTVGFLPVLGFWMIPLGLFVLAIDFPVARRLKRRAGVWIRRQLRKAGL